MSKGAEVVRPRQDEGLRIVNYTKLVPSARLRDPNLSSQTREELSRVVQQLFLSPRRGNPSVVMFSAIESGSGSTWTCMRIAETLADRTDDKVCVVDVDFRSCGRHRDFEFPEQGQMPDDEWTFAPINRPSRKPNDSNLCLLSYTPISRHSQTPASVQAFQDRIADLRHDFRYVLIDAPPLNQFADATLYGPMTDGIVMVLEANTTRRESARRAKRLLDDCGIPVLGAVLNKRAFPIPEPIYRRL